MDSGGAAAALCDLSPDANNANQVQTNIVQRTLPPPQQESLKQLYMSAIELCRHFWFCFPANSTFLQEKVGDRCLHEVAVDTFTGTDLTHDMFRLYECAKALKRFIKLASELFRKN